MVRNRDHVCITAREVWHLQQSLLRLVIQLSHQLQVRALRLQRDDTQLLSQKDQQRQRQLLLWGALCAPPPLMSTSAAHIDTWPAATPLCILQQEVHFQLDGCDWFKTLESAALRSDTSVLMLHRMALWQWR